MHTHDADIEALPNIYAVCMSDGTEERKITAAFVIAAMIKYRSRRFFELLDSAVAAIPELDRNRPPSMRFLSERVNMNEDGPLTEESMTIMLSRQYLKYQ